MRANTSSAGYLDRTSVSLPSGSGMPLRIQTPDGFALILSTDVVAKNTEATSVLISPGFGVLLKKLKKIDF